MNDFTVGAMGLTGLTVFLAEGWLNNVEKWVVAKTHGGQYVQVSTTESLWKWIFGLGMVSVVLVAGSDSDELGGVSKAFAGVIAATAVVTKGGTAVSNLKTLLGANSTSGTVPLPDPGGPGTLPTPVNTGSAGTGTGNIPSTLNGPAPGSQLYSDLFGPPPSPAPGHELMSRPVEILPGQSVR